MTQSLRGDVPTEPKMEAERMAIGGFRDTTESLKRLPSVTAFGQQLGCSIANLLNGNPHWITSTCACIGVEDQSPPAEAIEAVRAIIAEACGTTETGPVSNANCTTDIRCQLLEAWRLKSGDPDSAVAKWLNDGSPAGIREHAEPCGIFPVADDDAELDAECLATSYGEFENYAGVENDEAAIEEIAKHLKAGHLKAYDSVAELAAALGEDPILSKIEVITRTRAGRTKKRVILDTRESLLRWASAKGQRVLLPRLLDAIMCILELLASPCADEDFAVSAFVLDFAEAFWQVPLHPRERRFFCGKLTIDGREKFFTFLRMVQGSRSSPLCWARLAALLMRLTRSLFPHGVARSLCYVDDPLFLFAGTAAERKRMAATCILGIVLPSLLLDLGNQEGKLKT